MSNHPHYTPVAFAALSSDEMRTYAPEFAKHVDKSTLDSMYHKKFKKEQVTTAQAQRDHSLLAGVALRGSIKPDYDWWLAVQNEAMDKLRRGTQFLEESRRDLSVASAKLSAYNQLYEDTCRTDEAYESAVELAYCSMPLLPLFRKGAGPSHVEPTTPMHDPQDYKATYAAIALRDSDTYQPSSVPCGPPVSAATFPDDVEDEEEDEPTTLLEATGRTVAQLAHVSDELHDKFAHQWHLTSTWTKLFIDDLKDMFADELVLVYGPNHASDPLDFLVAYGYPHKDPVANRVDVRLWYGDPSTATQAGLRNKFTEGPASARKLCRFLDVGAAPPLAPPAPALDPVPLAEVAAAAVGAAMQAVMAAAVPPHGVPVIAGGLVKRAALLAAESPIAKTARREARVAAIDDPSPSYVPH